DRPFAAQENTPEVDGHDGVPVSLVRLEERLGVGPGDAGVVDDDVKSAAALECSRDEPVDVRRLRDVRLEAESPLADELLRRSPALTGIVPDVGDDYERAFVREAKRNRAPEPTCCARDDRSSP